MTLNIHLHTGINYDSPFMVTFDDIDSVDEDISPEESAHESELLKRLTNI